MAQTFEYDVVIIGAGPAGLTAGLYAGRSMLKAVMLERLGEPGGEILNTELVEDYPGFESIFGRELAEKFASHAAKFGAELCTFVIVERVEKGEDGFFTTTTDDGDSYRSPTVILTAGGTPIKLGVPGEEREHDGRSQRCSPKEIRDVATLAHECVEELAHFGSGVFQLGKRNARRFASHGRQRWSMRGRRRRRCR